VSRIGLKLVLTAVAVVAGVEAIQAFAAESNSFIDLYTIEGKDTIDSYSDIIVIRNNSNSTLDSIRLMLSPEIASSFYLDKFSIKSIGPNGNATVSIQMFGNPNRDVYGELTGYDGKVVVMPPNHSPIILPVKISSSNSDHYQAYMEKVEQMSKQRYSKLSLLNDLVSKSPIEMKDFDLTTSSGAREITSTSDELTIKNTSDKQINNIRIIVSKSAMFFIPDKSNIKTLAPNESITIKLIPRMDSTKYSPTDFTGEVIVAADNGFPNVIPIQIAREERKDSMIEFEVTTISDNIVTQAVDRITIKNNADRPMDSVKIKLSRNLESILQLSKDSFKTIAPGEEVTVDLKFKDILGEKVFMQSFKGELIVISEHHNPRTIPIKIEWNRMENEHFAVYSRSGDESIAKQVLDVLGENYQNITSRFGDMKSKTVIYMVGSLEEMKIINPSGHPYYSYADDTIFICACDDAEYYALKEFVYRIIINNHPGYYQVQKFVLDKENWLLDGISSYIAASMIDTGMVEKYQSAYGNNPTEIQWYGYGSLENYSATYTFFKYLESKYGSEVIDKSVYNLRKGMTTHQMCDTMENCAVLQAVYDQSGMRLGEKEVKLDVTRLLTEYQLYVDEYYMKTQEI